MNITRASLYLEIDGKVYVVVIDESKLLKGVDCNTLINYMGPLFKNGKLPAISLNNRFKFEELKPEDLGDSESRTEEAIVEFNKIQGKLSFGDEAKIEVELN